MCTAARTSGAPGPDAVRRQLAPRASPMCGTSRGHHDRLVHHIRRLLLICRHHVRGLPLLPDVLGSPITRAARAAAVRAALGAA